MRKLLVLLTALLLGHWLPAQNEVVVVHVLGEVSYFAPQQKQAQAVYPGQRLALDGSLRGQSGASIKLLYQGQSFTFEGGKKRELRELEQAAKAGSRLGFVSRFWEFLYSSVKQSADEKRLEEHHRQYMEKAYAGIKGFARQQDYPIRSPLLYAGKLSDALVTFQWSGMPPDGAPRFQIRRSGSGTALLSASVRDSTFSVHLAQLQLQPATEYLWQILPAEDTATGPRSAATMFTYDPGAAAEVWQELQRYHEYQHSTPVEQALMYAYALEDAGFWYDAAQQYAETAAAHPRNQLVRDARAAFLARMDLLQEAQALIKP
jgi:hypothetical protein